MDTNTRDPIGKANIPRDLDGFLDLAQALAKDERAAVSLMREAMVEAHRTWDRSRPEERCTVWLHEVMTTRCVR